MNYSFMEDSCEWLKMERYQDGWVEYQCDQEDCIEYQREQEEFIDIDARKIELRKGKPGHYLDTHDNTPDDRSTLTPPRSQTIGNDQNHGP